MENTFQVVEKVLKSDERIRTSGVSPQLLKAELISLVVNYDSTLLSLLLSDDKTKKMFFQEVEGSVIFLKDKLIQLVTMNEFLPSSYTKFENKIGLGVGSNFISNSLSIELVFPHKDCILEGGQTKEEQKRQEIFFNTVIAPQEIDRIREPKVLSNAKRYSRNGSKDASYIEESDNLIIKGNNLMALYCLLDKYRGRIKLIYIDPPYNTGGTGDTFQYNNKFKRSSRLLFMKNRLEVAKELLSSDGCIIVAIDENEQAHLGVLLQEVFNNRETHCITIVHNPRGVQGTNFSYTHEYAYFIVPKGKKSILDRRIPDSEIEFSNLRNRGGESLRSDAKNCFYPIIVNPNTSEVIGFGDVCDDNFNPKKREEKNADHIYIYPVDNKGVERKRRYARQSVESIKNLLRARVKSGQRDIEIGKNFGQHKSVWIDSRYDSNEYGTKIVNNLVPDNTFSFPKSLYNVKDCINAIVGNDKEAIVLDYHAGSGTTAHAILDINKDDGGNRKFIMIEQMDYIETVTCERVQKVIENQDSDDSFVYLELLENNHKYITLMQEADTTNEILKIKEQIEQEAFYKYEVDFTQFDVEDFSQLSLDEQKQVLLEVLDLNHLYVNLHSTEDNRLSVSEEDKQLTKQFYGLKD